MYSEADCVEWCFDHLTEAGSSGTQGEPVWVRKGRYIQIKHQKVVLSLKESEKVKKIRFKFIMYRDTKIKKK